MTIIRQHQILDSQFNVLAHVSPRRNLVTTTAVRLMGSDFDGNTLDTIFWSSAVTGSGAVTQTGTEVTLATGTTANSTARISTNKVGRFLSGCVNFYRGIVQLGDTGTANNTRRWGLSNAARTEGAFFELSGTSLRVVTRKSSSDTAVASGSWNGSAFTLDTNVHTYEIYWDTRRVWFMVDDVLVHTVSATTTPWANTMNLGLLLQNDNSGGSTSNLNIKARSVTVERWGDITSRPQFYNIANVDETRVLKYGAGTLHCLSLNAPDTTGTLILYDNTAGSGTIIMNIDFSKTSSITTLTLNGGGIDFSNGLTYVSASGIGDVTIYWD